MPRLPSTAIGGRSNLTPPRHSIERMWPREGGGHSDRETPLTRRTITLATMLVAVAFTATALFFTRTPDADAGQRTRLARAEAQISALRAQLIAERRRHPTDLTQRRRTSRSVPSVNHALALAAATYGVPVAKLRRVATCESTLNPKATNGRYVGLFQFGTPLWNATPYGRFSRTDPYAAAAAAAWAFKRGMARHWPLCGRR